MPFELFCPVDTVLVFTVLLYFVCADKQNIHSFKTRNGDLTETIYRSVTNTVARHAGRVNFGPTLIRSNILVVSNFVRLKKVKVAHTRLPSVRFRSWSRFLTVSLQVTWIINPAVGCQCCHYFPPDLQLPSQPLRGLLPISLFGEHKQDGCEQFA